MKYDRDYFLQPDAELDLSYLDPKWCEQCQKKVVICEHSNRRE